MRGYPVTTIGDVVEGVLEDEPAKTPCDCEKPPATMRGLDDLLFLVNPFVWLAGRSIGGAANASEQPGALDRLATSMGVDPVEYAIELTGYSGLGRYWPAMKVIGGVVAVGGAAVLAARALKKSKRKGKR